MVRERPRRGLREEGLGVGAVGWGRVAALLIGLVLAFGFPLLVLLVASWLGRPG